jgi:hypothetical protein
MFPKLRKLSKEYVMNKIRQQLLASGNVKQVANDAIARAKAPVRAVRGNDVTIAKQRKAMNILRQAVQVS